MYVNKIYKMEEKLKVSIVTVSFNQAKFLEEAICSVLDQDYTDTEYIVVDSGSTDGSRKIIEKYRDRIDKIIFEPDTGPAEGLNKGFKMATGKLFGYLNSDDYFLPNTLSSVVEYFEKHPKVDVIYGNALVIDSEGREIRKTYSDLFTLQRAAYGFSVIVQPSTFFRRSAFESTSGFDVENHSSWDYNLLIDMKLKGANYQRINSILSACRLHDESITGTARLNEQIKKDQRFWFTKIMKRNHRWFDSFVAQGFRLIRYATNPRDIFERLIKGPINGRYKR